MKWFTVRKDWSQTDQETVVVAAESYQDVKRFYDEFKATHGARAPRYVSIYPLDDALVLKAGVMKTIDNVTT